MTFDIMEIFSQIASIINDILSSFSSTRITLETIVNDAKTYDYLTLITPYVGTIRFVAGEYIFMMTIRLMQVGIFIGIAKAAYQLIHMLTSSVLVEKPLKLIKSFLGL